jgi:hypothetical protein
MRVFWVASYFLDTVILFSSLFPYASVGDGVLQMMTRVHCSDVDGQWQMWSVSDHSSPLPSCAARQDSALVISC